MEFGLFVQAHVPRHEAEVDPAGAEHTPLLREVELAEACDRHGFKYVWSVEHHFLEEYSHLSASEILLPFIAARTRRIHVGSAIWNLTPPVNHPARVAERVAMLDHLSEGRFEFGTGRGSSSTEFRGFGIPDGETTRAMFDEALREILRMWRETPYGYEGRFFSMPARNVLPKPWTRPHPPLWVACGSPSTFEKAARLGLGALCFSLGTPREFEPLIRTYKDTIRHAEPIGAYVNDNVACVTQLVCMEDRQKARAVAMAMGSSYHTSLVFRYLDTFPRPPGVPEWPRLIPEPDGAALEGVAAEVRALGRRALPVPTDVARLEDCRRLADAAHAELGRIDVLVNNAFRSAPYEPVEEASMEDWRRIFDVNLFGAVQLSQAVIPHMKARGGGSIVMIGSMSMRVIEPRFGGYAASKAALASAVQTMAKELGASGVRVNSVVPGYIWGPALERYFQQLAHARATTPEAVYAEIASRTSLNHIPDSEEVAAAVVFFASDLSRAVTGQALDVNGGHYFH